MKDEGRIKLALVEDQELIRKSLRIVLNMEPDLEVRWLAENGQEAIERCRADRPDVVLMDIQMPVLDGVEATKRIKAEWPEVQVIILTTFQEVDLVLGAMNAGAEGYLLKAMDPKDLVSGIRHVFRGETLIPRQMARVIFAQAGSGGATAPEPAAAAAPEDEFGLSEREKQVLKGLADGLSNKEIAALLFISEGTVRNYISSVYSKLDVRNRAEAARMAAERHWLTRPGRDNRDDTRH
ncbi:response regulator transcription factor [Gorillibacterium sp. sgz500922]|uniref:response regulator transcription factor n=1 Tax=Gorillibacterium sp. sgz500922 TaxID=3446694 RepID=UPI003F67A024